MMNYIFQHKLIAGVVLVVIIAAAWYGFTQTSTPPVLSTTGTTSDLSTGNPEADAANQNLVSTLLTLQAVQLDGTIFSDQAFLSLKDFTTQVINEPIGRTNPFAPLSRAAIVATSTGKITPNLFAPKK
ncbi:MAG TPA: hypothetical protein VMU25_01035 [Candidatus Paceibacterota bacterium]|nr:hypothetical protein [Candidatus Paceibacterota bacterium]